MERVFHAISDGLVIHGPVSYTHLDVYKRQGQYRVAIRAGLRRSRPGLGIGQQIVLKGRATMHHIGGHRVVRLDDLNPVQIPRYTIGPLYL